MSQALNGILDLGRDLLDALELAVVDPEGGCEPLDVRLRPTVSARWPSSSSPSEAGRSDRGLVGRRGWCAAVEVDARGHAGKEEGGKEDRSSGGSTSLVKTARA